MEIELKVNEINSVEKIITEVLDENDFYKMNGLVQNKNGINNKFLFPNMAGNNEEMFVSVKRGNTKPFYKVISEDEFFKIIGVTKIGVSKRSSNYQKHLYSCYLEAIEQNDDGYISDILYKALEYQSNLNYVKSLNKNKTFVKEWRRDFTDETAVEVFKRKGNLRIVNIVKERALVSSPELHQADQ